MIYQSPSMPAYPLQHSSFSNPLIVSSLGAHPMTTKLQDPRSPSLPQYSEKALNTPGGSRTLFAKSSSPLGRPTPQLSHLKIPRQSRHSPQLPGRRPSVSRRPAAPGRLPVCVLGKPRRPCPAPSPNTSHHCGQVSGGRPGLPPPLPHAPAGPQRPCRRPGAARRTHIGSSNLASQDLRASTSSMSMVQGRRARPPLLLRPAAGLRSPPPHVPSQLRVPGPTGHLIDFTYSLGPGLTGTNPRAPLNLARRPRWAGGRVSDGQTNQ